MLERIVICDGYYVEIRVACCPHTHIQACPQGGQPQSFTIYINSSPWLAGSKSVHSLPVCSDQRSLALFSVPLLFCDTLNPVLGVFLRHGSSGLPHSPVKLPYNHYQRAGGRRQGVMHFIQQTRNMVCVSVCDGFWQRVLVLARQGLHAFR